AAFDLLFLDDELERCGLPAINRDRVRDMKAIFWTDLSSMPADLRDRWLLAQPDMSRPNQRPPWYRALIAARMFA
ncbi:hypothetical protein, partial [Acinetobacter baumannii]|uniref:hypothetical protein n=1 Tax=Acinetobacter baumannii TaxID=470 RepID=UPI0013D6447D